jgi:hypothetical protein
VKEQKPLPGDGVEEMPEAGEMMLRRGMRHADTRGDLPQRQAFKAGLLDHFKCRLDQSLPEIAVMIGLFLRHEPA